MTDSAQRPFFSVITVCKNDLEGLKATYNSLIAQSCNNYEWLVVDASSTDGIPNWLNSLFKKQGTIQGSYISEPDEGLYDGMNKGLARATGLYIVFMNAGDLFYSSETLATVRQAAEKADLAIIYGHAYERDMGIKYAADQFFPAALLPTHHQAIYYARQDIDGLRYDLSFPIAADYKWTMQLAQKALGSGRRIYRINAPLCVFEGGGVSHDYAVQGRAEIFAIREEMHLYDLFMNRLYDLRHRLGWFLRLRLPVVYSALRSALRRFRI